MISQETVDASWEEVEELSEAEAALELNALVERQSELFVFVAAMCDDLSQEAAELAGYLTYMVYRMFEKDAGRQLPEIEGDTIETILDENERFFDSLEGTEEAILERIAGVMGARQPYVFGFIFELLFEEPETGEQPVIEEEEAGAVFYVLKTVIDVLDQQIPD